MKKRIKLEVTQDDIILSNTYRSLGQPPQCCCPVQRSMQRLSHDDCKAFAAMHVLVLNDKH